MSLVVASVSTLAYNSTYPYVITKPSGLAVGDLMIAHITDSWAVSPTWSLSSGWVEIAQAYTSDSSVIGSALFWKIADASDAAASNFTFNGSNISSTFRNSGGMLRITGHDAANPIGQSNLAVALNQAAPIFGNSVIPSVANSLLVMALGMVASNSAITTYAVTNNNPAWTEQWSAHETFSGNGHATALATGPYTAITTTGDSSVAGGSSNSDWASVLVAILPATVPVVTTQAVTVITNTTATGNGNITNIGGATPDKEGIVYGTVSYADPGNTAPGSTNYLNSTESSGSFTTGAFTISLTGLSPSTTYYARAYSHNSFGYAYGSEVSFITLPTPNTPASNVRNPILGEATVWKNRILYSLDQPNTTSAQNDDAGGVWMMANSEPYLPLIDSMAFLAPVSAYRPWGVRVGGLYADQTNTIKVGYQDTQATATSAQYAIATLDTVPTSVNSTYAYYVTLPMDFDSDTKKQFLSIRLNMNGKSSATMGISIYYRTDVDYTSLYDNNNTSVWTLLKTQTTDGSGLNVPIRKTGKNIQFKFVFTPASGFSPQLLDYSVTYEFMDQYR